MSRPEETSMPRSALLFAALCVPLLLSGCLDYSEALSLRSDGSGTLEATFSIDMGLMGELSQALGEVVDPAELVGPTRDEVLEALSVEGVTVRRLEVEPLGAKTQVRLTIEFADLEALQRIEGFSARRRIGVFDNGDGRALFVSRFDPRDLAPAPEFAATNEQALDVLRRIRESIRLESELRLPGPIVASNGHADVARPGLDVSAWAVDASRHPDRLARLGPTPVLMKVLCERSALPWARELVVAPEVGTVYDDALDPVPARTAVGASTPIETATASERKGGSGGCSLTAAPSAGSGAALSLLLVAGLFAFRARGRSAGAEHREAIH
jgi:hypothetical protein